MLMAAMAAPALRNKQAAGMMMSRVTSSVEVHNIEQLHGTKKLVYSINLKTCFMSNYSIDYS